MDNFEAIKRRMKLPFPLRGIERSVYLAVLLLLSMGVVLSFRFENWEYFGQCGSLVVVTGIMLAWRDLVSLVGDVEVFYKSTIDQHIAKMNASKPRGLIADAMHDGKIEKIVAASSDVEELLKMLRKRLRTTEALILIIGTVVSGYGAVIGRFVWKF